MMFMGIQSVPRSSGRQDHVGQKTSEVLVALRLRCIDSADFAIETDCYVRQTAHARPLQMTALPVLSVHFKDSMYSNLWIEKKNALNAVDAIQSVELTKSFWKYMLLVDSLAQKTGAPADSFRVIG
jgi:hypothetical protein